MPPTLVTLLACGCSSSSASPTRDAGADSGTADASGSEAAGDDGGASQADGAAADAAAACNDLANDAPVVTIELIPGTPPASQGGAIADGAYWLTAATIYTGEGDEPGSAGTGRTTIQITGSVIQVVTSGAPTSRTSTITTSGIAFTSTDACPDTSSQGGTYTATATTFVVTLPAGTDDAGAKTLVETFTKQ